MRLNSMGIRGACQSAGAFTSALIGISLAFSAYFFETTLFQPGSTAAQAAQPSAPAPAAALAPTVPTASTPEPVTCEAASLGALARCAGATENIDRVDQNDAKAVARLVEDTLDSYAMVGLRLSGPAQGISLAGAIGSVAPHDPSYLNQLEAAAQELGLDANRASAKYARKECRTRDPLLGWIPGSC